jgi:hypothetical protein
MSNEILNHGHDRDTLSREDFTTPPEKLTFTKGDFLCPTEASKLRLQRALQASQNPESAGTDKKS